MTRVATCDSLSLLETDVEEVVVRVVARSGPLLDVTLLESVPELFGRVAEVTNDVLLIRLKHEHDLAGSTLLGDVAVVQLALEVGNGVRVAIRERRDGGRAQGAGDVTHEAFGAQISDHVDLKGGPAAYLELVEAWSGVVGRGHGVGACAMAMERDGTTRKRLGATRKRAEAAEIGSKRDGRPKCYEEQRTGDSETPSDDGGTLRGAMERARDGGEGTQDSGQRAIRDGAR